jgi:hypothetical protein
MIYYRPTDGDPHSVPIGYRPKTCFLMTQLGDPVPGEVTTIRKALQTSFEAVDFECIDAESFVTGRDFLLKIWELIVSVPVGVAIIHQDMKPTTIANIFYEMGLMQAYGKETLVVKTRDATVPSDFIRTEYIEHVDGFSKKIGRFVDSLAHRAEYYLLMADQVENNPLLALDFMRRSFLLTGEAALRARAQKLFESAALGDRAKSSVEMLLLNSFG